MSQERGKHSTAFKPRVALEAVKVEEAVGPTGRPVPRCSTGLGMPQMRTRTQGDIHRNECWYHRWEPRDSRLIPPRYCPDNLVHPTVSAMDADGMSRKA